MAVDFVEKSFQLSDGSAVKCFIYDTAGQERYNSINESYYKNTNGILLVYDISNKESFEKIENYYCPKIEEYSKKNIPIILLGNKADKENERQVSIEEGTNLAVEHKFKFKETSCLKNENVADAFEDLIEMWNDEYIKTKELEERGVYYGRGQVLLMQKLRDIELQKRINKIYLMAKYNSFIFNIFYISYFNF